MHAGAERFEETLTHENQRMHFLLIKQKYYDVFDTLANEIVLKEAQLESKEAQLESKEALLELKEAKLESKEAEVKRIVESNQAEVKRIVESNQAEVKRIVESNQAEVKRIVEGNRICISVYEKWTNILENQVADLKIANLLQISRFQAIMSNLTLIEVGTMKLFRKQRKKSASFSKRVEAVVQSVFLSGGKLTSSTMDVLHDLGCTSKPSSILKELSDLPHELLEDHHRTPSLSGRGIAVGGDEPLGCTVALVVLYLQREGCLPYEVRFVDRNGNDKRILCNDKVLPTSDEQSSLPT